MKTIFAILILATCFIAEAATNLVNLQYIGGTSNMGFYYASNIYIPRQKFIFQSLGITNTSGYSGSYTTNRITNSLVVNIQISIDGSNTNWVTLTTWRPSTTNATVETFDSELERIALPIRAQVVTTNPIGTAVFKQ